MKNQNTYLKRKSTSLAVAFCLTLPVFVSGLTGCAGDRYQRSTGEYIDDKSLNVRVKNALHDAPEYKYGDVEVASFKGNVQLSGFVNSSDQKRKATQIAQNVQGVKDVENNITVKP